MDRQKYIDGLEEMNLSKEDFIILSGGSLLLRGIRRKTADYVYAFPKN